MATFTWYTYSGAGPAWVNVSTNTLVFSGSLTDLASPIAVGAWNTGTHVGNGDPGTDQCGANHARNVKFISSTQFDSGSGTETLNDTNLAETECTLRITFTDAQAVAVSSARFYCYDGTTETVEAPVAEAYAFERGVGASAWTKINDDSTSFGGDNAGERLSLSDQSAATEHTFFVALTASPETVGGKTAFNFGIALTYS